MNTKRHKHADLIHAWADGAEIEIYDPSVDRWKKIPHPSFGTSCKYRIKPTPKPDVVRHYCIDRNGFQTVYLEQHKNINLRCTFDGETGELKSAEVIK